MGQGWRRGVLVGAALALMATLAGATATMRWDEQLRAEWEAHRFLDHLPLASREQATIETHRTAAGWWLVVFHNVNVACDEPAVSGPGSCGRPPQPLVFHDYYICLDPQRWQAPARGGTQAGQTIDIQSREWCPPWSPDGHPPPPAPTAPPAPATVPTSA